MEKLLLFDGHSILNRAYYALPPLTNAKGLYTNAVYGFLNIMMKFVDENSPDYLMVAFDEHAPTFRHELFADYKGNRKKMDEELRSQVPMIQKLLSKMDIPIIKKAGLEADDILGTIAKKAQEKGLYTVIVSGDRDLLQLADSHIKIAIPKTKAGQTIVEEYEAKDVMEKMGVTPMEFIDVKALWGDSSDNIPGVTGIGEKTAFSLISTYHSLEEAYSHVEEIKPKRASENLAKEIEIARLSKVLATINIKADVEFSLEEARYKSPYTPEAYELCKEWELKQFLKRFTDTPAASFAIEKKVLEFSVINSKDDLSSFLSRGGEYLSIAYLNKEDESPVMGLTIEDNHALCFFEGLCLGDIMESFDGEILGFDFKSMHGGYESVSYEDIKRLSDYSIAAYLIDPTRRSYEDREIISHYLSVDISPFKEVFGKESILELLKNEKDKLGQYLVQISYYLYALKTPIEEKIAEFKLVNLYRDIEMPLSYVLFSMEREGIALDRAELLDYNQMLLSGIKEMEAKIYEMAGESFNINSPKQLGVILFEKLGLPYGKKTKTGYSTAADVLEKLAEEYPIVKEILLYRQYSKLHSTYGEGLLSTVDADGRVRTTFQQTVTATGRLSSTNPNLQNIPIRMEMGRQIRKVFKPKEGYVFLDGDYSQIELRVLAHMSGDENLISAYRENKDIHRATAAKVFGKPFEEVTDFERSSAKAVNFGIVYGISSFGLGVDLNISRAQAQKYIDDYYKAYPSLKGFLDSLVSGARERGFATTMYGRRRPIPELSLKNHMQRQFGERIAMNTPIQGSAADIIKIAMIRVYEALKREGLKSRLILQVHDELLIEAHESEIERVRAILKEGMESACDLLVPLIVDIHEGTSWFEAK